MSDIRKYLEMVASAFGRDNPFALFMLTHGREYKIGPDTFAGERGEEKMCYMNATHLAHDRPDLTYVEGKIIMFGIPIDHAWCVDADGTVVDPTLKPGRDGTMDRITEYYGVPFTTEYLRKATVISGYYGLLDGMMNRDTLPVLLELGLEAGQKAVIASKPKKKKGRSRGAA